MHGDGPARATAEQYDFIVVGAGAAGSVAAARLSQSGRHRVLLLETGTHDAWHWLRVPAGVAWVLNGERALTSFRTQPEAGLAGRSIALPRGTVVGGTSRINGMIWGRGDPAEFDRWAADGCSGWRYADVLPFYRAIEAYRPPRGTRSDPERGDAGPMAIVEYAHHDRLSEAFLRACADIGVARTADYNVAPYGGAGYLQFNTRHGLRWSTWEAYLQPAMRRANLEVRTGVHAQRIVIDAGRAVAVEYDGADGRRVVRAAREIVVCAGAIQSPQLLELSGIGDRAQLRRLGIRPLVDLPGVGENLRDHLQCRLVYRARGVVTLNDLLRSRFRRAGAMARYATTRSGLLASTACTVQALLARAGPNHRPDVKFQLYHMSNIAAPARADGKPSLDAESGFTIGVIPLRPRSTGSVHATSRDLRAAPRIVANYLSDAEDRAVIVDAFRVARRMADGPALRPYRGAEIAPSAAVQSDAEILDYVARTASTSYHPVGTCRMGTDPMAVVDPQLRVHGVRGLRVADASIMPTLVSQNTHAPTILIGERVAAFLLADADADADADVANVDHPAAVAH